IFSWIAVFILIIACINYMNLSTAQASRRIKEIGVKKAIGANRKELIFQYFNESMFITFLSLILAIGFVALLLPSFNVITGKSLTLAKASHLFLPALVFAMITGFVSGIYPGLYLSGFKPVSALKGKTESKSGGLWFRKGLVVFQFTASVALIISVIVIYQQMNFMRETNLGYDQEHLISFNREGKLYESDAKAFMEEVKNLSGVVHMSYLWGQLPGRVSGGSAMQWEGMDREASRIDFSFIEGGYDMAKVLGVEFKEGRSLSEEFATDEVAVVLNESAAKIIEYENPVGRRFYNGNDVGQIVGLVKDFHFDGLHEEIGPFFFMYSEDGDRFMAKIQGENQMQTIRAIEKLHEAFNPGYPFEFNFVDDSYQQQYLEEQRVSKLAKYFSAIAITISCLGLLALTAFSTQRRFKEIAIRKVLGSTNLNIMQLLSKEYILLVLLAILIAVPISFYLMKSWLEGFAYRIELQLIYFVLSSLLILFIASVTIMGQITNAARVNVTESLKSEG
ncbi:MAG: FtsX-like permease family protein, partial [Ekhidna sp.]|nr:FtsX-like permease family protein [Ekhidna sp.]